MRSDQGDLGVGRRVDAAERTRIAPLSSCPSSSSREEKAMTGQKVMPTIDKVISDEVRKDFGMTPTFPVEETKVADDLVETPHPEADDGAGVVGKNRGANSNDGKTPA
jgi:hypothetical protein